MKTKIFSCFLLFLFLLSSSVWAQDLQLTGRVITKNGSGLPGVSVSIKGTKRSTLSNESGDFKIMAPQNAVLVFNYIGMEIQEFKVTNASPISISLNDANSNLDEVVVIGYGTQKKSVVTGAISSVKAKDLENAPIMRVEQALQGRASGLTIAASSGQPGSGSTVRVRGTTSINNSEPLYVVDGVVIQGGIDYLNQNDIESIEVLKDAASAAIYGTRAAAGVILITTKKGRAGAMRVAYNGYVGTQAPAHKLKLLNATEYATLRNESALAANKPLPFPNASSLGEGTDWQSVIFNNNARVQNHDISLSGGNAVSTYFTSFGFYEQQGIVATDISKYKRFNVRMNSDHKIKDWLRIGNTVGYSYIRTQGIGNTNSEFGGPLSSAINLDPITPVVITDPSVAGAPPYSNHTVYGDANGNPYGISNIVTQEIYNPKAYIKGHEGNYGWSHNVVGNIYVEIEPIKNLKLRSTIGTKIAFWGGQSFTPVAYYNSSTSNSVNSFYRENNRVFEYTWENTLSYNKKLGYHNLTGIIGTGAYSLDNTVSNGVTYQNLPVNTYAEASMNFSTPAANITAWGGEGTLHKLSSLFARVIYDYQEKYLFTGIIRRDGSTRFGKNNKYGYFPGVSAGWVVSKENFWPQNRTISMLKVRGSYGVTGNDDLGNFAYSSIIGSGYNYTFGNNDVYTIGNTATRLANPDLKWEQTSQTNIGIEATVYKNFFVTFDWFNKKTTDMLRPLILPGYTGIGNPYANIASMKNTGFEIELGYNKKIGEVNFTFKGNVSKIKNEVTFISNGVDYFAGASIQSSNYELTRVAVGHAIGSFYGFEKLGVFQTQSEVDNYVSKTGGKIQPGAKPGDYKWADLNDDGQIGADDRKFIGDPTPNLSYGITINADYKGFDFVVLGQGVSGNDIYNGLRRLDIPTANYTTAALGRWTGAGTSNTFARLSDDDLNHNFSNPSSFYLSDGSYFRIKVLQVGYRLPEKLIKKSGLQRARIYVGANNLVTFTKYTGYDPEIGGTSYGIDRGIYPQARSFMVGLNLGL